MRDYSSSNNQANDEAGNRHVGHTAAAQTSPSNGHESGHFYDAHDYDDGLVHSHNWAVNSVGN